MKRTYVDSGVLIDAARGKAPHAMDAIRILDDPEREFVSSAFVKLEVRPKAVHNKQHAEIKFYDEFFRDVVAWADSYPSIVADAEDEAETCGLQAMDALHVAAAASVAAEELVTTEKRTRPLHRARRVTVICIYAADDAGSGPGTPPVSG
jgi:predicted nucleic acid-binding protein